MMKIKTFEEWLEEKEKTTSIESKSFEYWEEQYELYVRPLIGLQELNSTLKPVSLEEASQWIKVKDLPKKTIRVIAKPSKEVGLKHAFDVELSPSDEIYRDVKRAVRDAKEPEYEMTTLDGIRYFFVFKREGKMHVAETDSPDEDSELGQLIIGIKNTCL